MRRQAESDERWMQQVWSQYETPTAATLDANKVAATTTIDVGAHPKVTMKDDDIMKDEDEAEMIIRTLGGCVMVTLPLTQEPHRASLTTRVDLGVMSYRDDSTTHLSSRSISSGIYSLLHWKPRAVG
jgi:hypothetical protein